MRKSMKNEESVTQIPVWKQRLLAEDHTQHPCGTAERLTLRHWFSVNSIARSEEGGRTERWKVRGVEGVLTNVSRKLQNETVSKTRGSAARTQWKGLGVVA